MHSWLFSRFTQLLEAGGNETSFMYPDAPDNADGWSMCSENNAIRDNRVLLNFGPMIINPTGVNEMTFAVIGVEHVPHPCPSLTPILNASTEVEDFYNETITATNEVFLSPTGVSVMPNPMTNSTIIALTSTKQHINNILLYDMRGKIVRNAQHLQANQYLFEKKNLASGMYIYKLITDNGAVGTGKILVE